MIFMCKKGRKRKVEEDKDTKFYYRGWLAGSEKIQRFGERNAGMPEIGSRTPAGACPSETLEVTPET
jgi:hypothetical protein